MNDIRSLITLVESEQLNEKGGMIDSLLANVFGNKKAAGKVLWKEAFKALNAEWKEYQGINDVGKNDINAFKKFLITKGIDSNTIQSVVGSNDVKTVINDLAKKMASENNGISGDITDYENDISDDEIHKGTISDTNLESVIKYYKHNLAGDIKNVGQLARRAGNNPNRLKNKSPLARLGHAFLLSNGAIDK